MSETGKPSSARSIAGWSICSSDSFPLPHLSMVSTHPAAALGLVSTDTTTRDYCLWPLTRALSPSMPRIHPKDVTQRNPFCSVSPMSAMLALCHWKQQEWDEPVGWVCVFQRHTDLPFRPLTFFEAASKYIAKQSPPMP